MQYYWYSTAFNKNVYTLLESPSNLKPSHNIKYIHYWILDTVEEGFPN